MSARTGPLEVGRKFLNYEIIGVLGEGGHACVYRARRQFTGVEVAIKVLRKATPQMQRRAQREARTLLGIQHPNVIKVIDADIADVGDGLIYIVMELPAGRTLHDVLNEHGRLEVDEALKLFIQIADGVHAAHEIGVIHRDLKPSNILVTEGNGAKVLDFGVVKLIGHTDGTTQKNVVIGTLLYMAPEQLEGNDATVRSDVHALGVMLYEALTGETPYNLQNALTLPQVVAALYTQTPKLASDVDSFIPVNVAKIVDRAIQKLPPHRYASARELADALRRALSELEGSRRTTAERALWRNETEQLLRPWSVLPSAAAGTPNPDHTLEDPLPVDVEPTEPDFVPVFATGATAGLPKVTLRGLGAVAVPVPVASAARLSDVRGHLAHSAPAAVALPVLNETRPAPRTPVSGTRFRVEPGAEPAAQVQQTELPRARRRGADTEASLAPSSILPSLYSRASRRSTAIRRAVFTGVLFGSAAGAVGGVTWVITRLRSPSTDEHVDALAEASARLPGSATTATVSARTAEAAPATAEPPAPSVTTRAAAPALEPSAAPPEARNAEQPASSAVATASASSPGPATPPKAARKVKKQPVDVMEERLRWFEEDMKRSKEPW